MSQHLNPLGQPVGESLADWQVPPHPPGQILEGRLARLEPLVARHAASLYAAHALDADNRNWTYLPYGPFDTFDSYCAWIDRHCRGRDPLFYAIVERTSDAAVGVASYLRVAPASGSIEVGHINFSPRLQQTPAATEAMYLLMKHAFELGYRRYEWKCDALNAPSRAAALRLGLSFEGIFRQATVVKGRNRDTAWYAAIDREWPLLDAAFARWLDPANFDAAEKQRVALSALTRLSLQGGALLPVG
ncbi:GNAT family protein [Accumulibacter sp.]|uniref:GCN5-related N-acetyltransferase n=1 Tax=Accumulibacter regalis TaxID=522306 RepID=C7RMS6_ACCRE|nr:GNAT family protein [Accumulibacter sp.]MBN8495474.1 GNAT family N-acetyltransferase [Accumulibacter sp.]MBO3714088.1 GNAT family N-acetyltransferase [Accumulibacter sp.]